MILKAFILTSIHFIAVAASGCYLASQVPNEMGAINSARQQLFASNDYQEFSNEAASIPHLFGLNIRSVCRDMPRESIASLQSPQKRALGSGAYGKVFLVNFASKNAIQKDEKAVKQISFKSYINKKLKKYLTGDSTDVDACMESVIRVSVNKEVFKIPNSYVQDFQKKHKHFKSKKENLEPVGIQLFDTDECKRISGYLIVEKYVRTFFKTLKNEINVSVQLNAFYRSDKSMSRNPTFSEFNFCIIDDSLNVFLVLEKLDHTLEKVVDECPNLLYENDIHRRLKMYMRLLYQIDKMHSIGITHCDIKPLNILYRNGNYDTFNVADFGFSTKGFCQGGSINFWPPEGFLDDEIDPKLLDNITKRPQVQKYDSFSIGMVMLKIELGRYFETVEDAYLDIQELEFIEDIFESENDMFDEIRSAFEIKRSELNPRTDSMNVPYTDNKIENLLIELVLSMMRFKYTERISVRAALYYIYKLHMATGKSKTKVSMPEDIKDYLKNSDKFIASLEDTLWYESVEQIIWEKSLPTSRNTVI